MSVHTFFSFCLLIVVHGAQEHKPPPILRPVELTLVPDSVSTFEDVANTLTRCCEVCTLLSNQRRVMKNTFFLRASLITHMVTRVSERESSAVVVEHGVVIVEMNVFVVSCLHAHIYVVFGVSLDQVCHFVSYCDANFVFLVFCLVFGLRKIYRISSWSTLLPGAGLLCTTRCCIA